MNLKKKIEEEIKNAMLNKAKDRLIALRSIKSLILLAETKSGNKQVLDKTTELKILTKAAKQRRDSIEIFEKQNRQDLVEKEAKELAVIETFLPPQLSEKEIKEELISLMKENDITESREMGRLMGLATKKLDGRADGKKISIISKSLLS